jgi:putative ATP-dependent endonuclease of the OLD family
MIKSNVKFKHQPMRILIDQVRIKNFRSLRDVEVSLQPVTLLVGANNAGKTTFLRAINTVLGVNKTQINRDDLFIDGDGNQPANSIIIDIRIIPVDVMGNRIKEFENQWNGIFGGDAKADEVGEFFAFRTEIKFSNEGDKYESNQYFLTDWKNPNPRESERLTSSVFKAVLLYFIDAQRDLQDDVKLRNSYFGKLATQLSNDYDDDSMTEINTLVKTLNDTAVGKSKVLSHLQEKLSELNRTTQTKGNGVSISPFPKKIRDLHKGMKVDFQDSGSDAFSLEYHGMGTRSWASILSFNAFTSWETQTKAENSEAYFPILALEEPEAHLHPNAQRTLYRQLANIGGQKIISTHSPYIAGQAELDELRHFYKDQDQVKVSQLYFSQVEEDRIKELLEEIEVKEKSKEINKQNRPIIEELKKEKRKKLNAKEAKKIRREVMNTRGELLFAKAIILFEGETEEQALPILAKEYFNDHYPHELGLNFVGVGGKGKYQPFLNVAKFLNIPWYIFSDGDGNTEEEVKEQIEGIFSQDYSNLFVLDDNADFEKHLIDEGFKEELVKAINESKGDSHFPDEYMKNLNGHNRKGGTTRDYLSLDGNIKEGEFDRALLDCLREGKTEFAESIANNIAAKRDENGKCILPKKIKELFAKINEDLQLNVESNEAGIV